MDQKEYGSKQIIISMQIITKAFTFQFIPFWNVLFYVEWRIRGFTSINVSTIFQQRFVVRSKRYQCHQLFCSF